MKHNKLAVSIVGAILALGASTGYAATFDDYGVPVDLEGAQDVLVGDFDGDGADDLLFLSRSADHGWYVSWGGETVLQPWTSGSNTQFGGDQYLVGDFDGDGRDDVFTMQGRDWWVAYSNGRADAPTWVKVKSGVDSAVLGIQQLAVANVSNRSGESQPIDDLVWFSESDKGVGVWLGQARRDTQAFVGRYDRWLTGYYATRPKSDYLIHDFDRNGLSDVFLNAGSEWHIAYGFKNWVRTRANVSKPAALQRVGNVFQDGNPGKPYPPDIIWFTDDSSAGWRVWEGTGSTSQDSGFNGWYSLATGQGTGHEVGRYLIGDFDGNGLEEIGFLTATEFRKWEQGRGWQFGVSLPKYRGQLPTADYAKQFTKSGQEFVAWGYCLDLDLSGYANDCIQISTRGTLPRPEEQSYFETISSDYQVVYVQDVAGNWWDVIADDAEITIKHEHPESPHYYQAITRYYASHHKETCAVMPANPQPCFELVYHGGAVADVTSFEGNQTYIDYFDGEGTFIGGAHYRWDEVPAKRLDFQQSAIAKGTPVCDSRANQAYWQYMKTTGFPVLAYGGTAVSAFGGAVCGFFGLVVTSEAGPAALAGAGKAATYCAGAIMTGMALATEIQARNEEADASLACEELYAEPPPNTPPQAPPALGSLPPAPPAGTGGVSSDGQLSGSWELSCKDPPPGQLCNTAEGEECVVTASCSYVWVETVTIGG